MSSTPARPNLHLLGAVFSWGLNFVAVKIVVGTMSPSALAFGRIVIQAVALGLICAIAGGSLRYRSWQEAWRLNAVGALSMGVYMVLFLEALARVPSGAAAVLMATSPLWTFLLEGLFKLDRVRWGTAFGALVAFTGVAMVVQPSAGQPDIPLFGAGLMLLAALLWALSVVLSRFLVDDRPPLEVVALGAPGALLVLAPYGFAGLLQVPWTALSLDQWAWFLFIGLGAGAFGFWTFFTGVKKVGPSGAMLYQFLVPPTALLCAFLILGEQKTVVQLLGVVVTLAGVAWAAHAKAQPQKSRLVSE